MGKVGYEHGSRGHVVPGPRGKVLFTGIGMFSSVGMFPNQQVPYPGADPKGRYLPACHGDYYLNLASPLSIYKLGLEKPILTFPDIDIPPPDDVNLKHDFTMDKHIFLIPQARVLITIPHTNDRLILHRVNLEEALDKMNKGKKQP
jgi:hypothetical protein